MTISTPHSHGTLPTGVSTGDGTLPGTGTAGMIPTGHGTGVGDPTGDGVHHGAGGRHGVGVPAGDGVRLGAGVRHGVRAGLYTDRMYRDTVREITVRHTDTTIPA